MRLTTTLLAMVVLAGSAGAQGVYAESVKKAKAVAADAKGKDSSAAPADPMKPKAAAKPAAGKSQATASSTVRTAGKRDPFISPVVRAAGGPSGPACNTGKRCLAINQITIKGIIKSKDGMLALVESAAKRSYVLRENDEVFNGQVVRITQDTIVFREKVHDNLGREIMREVSKKLTPAA